MGIEIAKEITIESSWANSEQPEKFTGGKLVSKTASWQDYLDQEQPVSKADFKRALKKVSRKVKK